MSHSTSNPRVLVFVGLVVSAALGCARGAAVQTASSLPLHRVVVYRNGIGYFERQGHVQEDEVRFRVAQREVGDFLATLAVMERGGSSVRAAAFPMPEERADGPAAHPEERRTVRLALDGHDHDLVVGYTVETPIWRPSYRLVFDGRTTQVQAWGIVQNLSGEDWSNVRLSLVSGAPVSFRSELAQAVIPTRPVVTDQGAVIDAVPTTETTLAQDGTATTEAPPAPDANASDQPDDAFGYGGLGLAGSGLGGGGTGEGTIGLGDVGTMGHGAATGTGQGYGSGAGRGLRGRSARGPLVRAAPPQVSGSLSPEAIRRVVLRNLGQVTHCHEQGLAQRPNAAGRITVRFVITPSGAVGGSGVASSTYPVGSVGSCIASAVRRWQFPSPEGGGVVTVNYPFNLWGDGDAQSSSDLMNAPAAPAPSSAPRNVAALAALAVQGGATRYDLPNPVTVPDRSATMVMLASREIPGEQMYLFAPDPGVADSVSHPFHVARFENRTGALLERGPVAIFEAGAFLGQGMLDALPDGATTTVPFALERALAVESTPVDAVEGARLVSMLRDALTIERFNVRRTTWRVRNGMDREARVMIRQVLSGADLFEPPQGTERSNGNALVPLQVPSRSHAEVVVTTRAPFSEQVALENERAGDAIEQYLRDAHPEAEVARALRAAIDLRRDLVTMSAQYADLSRRREDLQQNSEETRENLRAIQRNPQAADLRAQLTTRLARVATELDQLTRRIVELDTQMSERRVRLAETVRTIDIDTSRQTAPAAR